MKALSMENERTVLEFNGLLWGISGPDDMFPPDNGGDRAEIAPDWPLTPTSESLALCGVERVIRGGNEWLRLVAV